MTIQDPRTLEEQTRSFWLVSRCWHGRPTKGFTVQEALQMTSSVLANTNPARRIALRMFFLQEAIIIQPERRKKA